MAHGRKIAWGLAIACCGLLGALNSAHAQTVDLAIGRHLAETTCNACHQINAAAPDPGIGAPSFVAISRLPSTTEIAIKVFLRTSHAQMPNIILTADEIDSVAAYILSLAGK